MNDPKPELPVVDNDDKFIFLNENFALENGLVGNLNYLVYTDPANLSSGEDDLEFAVSIDNLHITYDKTSGIRVISEEEYSTTATRMLELQKEKAARLTQAMQALRKEDGAEDEAAPAPEPGAEVEAEAEAEAEIEP